MADIIRLLPDSVANQIAAGEVIQRPASVIKELMENAVDSGAGNILVHVKDAGRTLIQVSDNGCGMSETDARMAFERHATSKIRNADDLFNIRTMGFRGEALASIAAIADVELKTKRVEDETGTFINICASKIEKQEPVGCSNGTSFSVKNLFFNVPARRKFLKSDSTELRNILTEFQHVALANPGVSFSLFHNNTELYNLPTSNLRQRIVNVFGKSLNQQLVPISTETSIVKIGGFIGKPEFARKRSGEQYFFVNNRYMRHPYFHKAIMKAYEQILPDDEVPQYFIYFEVDPETIDVNIHPTKTEIKFENEQALWQFLHASSKEALGKNNIVPSLDFEQETAFEIPVLRSDSEINTPEIRVNPFFNPFDEEDRMQRTVQPSPTTRREQANLGNWEKLYNGFENENHSFTARSDDGPIRELNGETAVQNYFQFKGKYILTPIKSGLMIIDQKRAHERILYEKHLNALSTSKVVAQQTLFPETIELSAPDHQLMLELSEELNVLGFDVSNFGNNTLVINAHPADLTECKASELLEVFLEEYKTQPLDITKGLRDKLARSMAAASSINYGRILSGAEMRDLVDNLFACENPNYSPSGKTIISMMTMDEFEKRF